VMVDLAEQLAENDPELAEEYGFSGNGASADRPADVVESKS
jgi:hypothetical protein